MQRINEDIKTGNFKQIYLLYGEERYLKNQYTTRLRKALCQEGDEMNTHFYQGKDFSVGEVIDLAETLPFLAERRVMFSRTPGSSNPAGKSWQNIWQAPITPPFSCSRRVRWISAANSTRPYSPKATRQSSPCRMRIP